MVRFFLQYLPFHIIPLAIFTVAIVLLVRNRDAIGGRRVTFGIWGFALLIFDRIVPSALYQLMDAYFRDSDLRSSGIQSIVIRNYIIGIGASIIEAVAIWFLFLAISNRRKC